MKFIHMKYSKRSKFLVISFFLFAFGSTSYSIHTQGNSDYLFNDDNDYNKIEEEIRGLRGKIEILEHNIHDINKILNIQSTKLAPNEDKNNSDIDSNLNPEGIVNERENINIKVEYNILLNYIKTHDYSKAEEKCKFILSKLSDTDSMSIDLHFIYGEILFRQKNYSQAALEYLKSYKIDPYHQKAPPNLYKLALSLGNMGKIEKACNILKKLENYPSKSKVVSELSKELFIHYNCGK